MKMYKKLLVCASLFLGVTMAACGVTPTTTSSSETTNATTTTSDPTISPDTSTVTKDPTTGEITVTEPTQTTVEPTTVDPTSVEPTTVEPTSVDPTSEEPTTVDPTSEEPTTPPVVLVESIEVSPSTYVMHIGNIKIFNAKVLPYKAADRSVTWSVSDPSLLNISAGGMVTAIEKGDCDVIATANDGSGVTGIAHVKISDYSVVGVEFSKDEVYIPIGTEKQLEYSILPSDAANKGVSFATSDPNVALVNEKGVVTGISEGSATITITTDDGGYQDFCTVFIKPVSLEKVFFDKEEASISVNGTFKLEPQFYPESATHKELKWESDNDGIVSVSDNGLVAGISVGEAIIKATSLENNEIFATIKIIVEEVATLQRTKLDYTYMDYIEHNYYPFSAVPSLGKAGFLVIPVWFTDSSKYIQTEDKKVEIINNINIAYFGTNKQTGWRSVKTYYEELSKGRVEITGEVTPWYECGKNIQTVGNSDTAELVNNAVKWYKNNFGSTEKFDCDGDGYIDSVSLIYACPDQQRARVGGTFWAYTSWVMNERVRNVSNPGANVYLWASYDFMYGKGDTYCAGDSRLNVDAHTFIHEMGHNFGIDDYYDYSGNYSPAGGFSMQDYNVGSHDPYSVMALGWADPYVVTNSFDGVKLSLNDFQSTNELVVLTNDKKFNSPFGEYIIIELFTPTGLNEQDSNFRYADRYPTGPKTVGVRIWHVDTRLLDIYAEGYAYDELITEPDHDYVYHAFSNSYGGDHASFLGSDYYNLNLLQYIRKDKNATYKPVDGQSPNNLFYAGDTFSVSQYRRQFVNGDKMNSGETLSAYVKFETMTNNSVILSISW